MISLLTVYILGAFLCLVFLGCVTAMHVLTNRVTLVNGMVLFDTLQAAGRQLVVSLIWPMSVSYYIAYRALLYYSIFMHNREVKKQNQQNQSIPIAVDVEEPTPVVTTVPFTELN